MASLKEANMEQKGKLNEKSKVWDDTWLCNTTTKELFTSIEEARMPLKYLASLFSAGNEEQVKLRLKKMMAVRLYRRHKTVGDITQERSDEALKECGLTPESADAIYYLTSLAKFDDRFVIPPAHREQAIEMLEFAGDAKGSTGFGFHEGTAQRGL